MKKRQLKIKDLSVKSFVTDMSESTANTAKGGTGNKTFTAYPVICLTYNPGECTNAYVICI